MLGDMEVVVAQLVTKYKQDGKNYNSQTDYNIKTPVSALHKINTHAWDVDPPMKT